MYHSSVWTMAFTIVLAIGPVLTKYKVYLLWDTFIDHTEIVSVEEHFKVHWPWPAAVPWDDQFFPRIQKYCA